MRGENSTQGHMFTYLSPEQRVPADHPLRPIKESADQVLKELSRTFRTMYSEVGRPSIPPERLLKAQVLIALYSVRSDRSQALPDVPPLCLREYMKARQVLCIREHRLRTPPRTTCTGTSFAPEERRTARMPSDRLPQST
jgi:hypothetical protein